MTTVKTVSLKDLGKEIKAFSEHAIHEQKQAVVLGLAKSLPGLAERSPVDTGHYASSWDMTWNEKQALIGNTAPHAPIIEFGARPFNPPIKPLLAWAKRVLNDPSQPPQYSPRVRALAYGTAAKIRERGIQPPRLVLTNAFDLFIRNIVSELERIKL